MGMWIGIGMHGNGYGHMYMHREMLERLHGYTASQNEDEDACRGKGKQRENATQMSMLAAKVGQPRGEVGKCVQEGDAKSRAGMVCAWIRRNISHCMLGWRQARVTRLGQANVAVNRLGCCMKGTVSACGTVSRLQ